VVIGKRTVLTIVAIILTIQLIQAQNTHLYSYFDIEGNDPQLLDDSLHFSALKSKYISTNGHGWRNELKKKNDLRKDMYDTVESISARVRITLSPGVKTIFTQYHGNDTSTLFLLFISDIRDKDLINGIAVDGIFDVYFIATKQNGDRINVPLSTIKSNDQFVYSIKNDKGKLTILFNDMVTEVMLKDSPQVYLKFGNYLQAQDPYTGEQSNQKEFAMFYVKNGIVNDDIVFESFEYKSE